jgi:hypothetical protein
MFGRKNGERNYFLGGGILLNATRQDKHTYRKKIGLVILSEVNHLNPQVLG